MVICNIQCKGLDGMTYYLYGLPRRPEDYDAGYHIGGFSLVTDRSLASAVYSLHPTLNSLVRALRMPEKTKEQLRALQPYLYFEVR